MAKKLTKGQKAKKFLKIQGFEFHGVSDRKIIESANVMGYKWYKKTKEWGFSKKGESFITPFDENGKILQDVFTSNTQKYNLANLICLPKI